MVDPVRAFSPSYRAARRRFREAAGKADFTLEAHPIEARGPAGEELTIDVAIRPAINPAPGPRRAVFVTSGLHGVEGFFGSAVQLALLEDADWLTRAEAVDVVLAHALNPYGFAWRRRWNEDNIDLNRSFRPQDEPPPEIPDLYRDLIGWLNPARPPSKSDAFSLEAAGLVAAHGLPALLRTLPIGQYEFPKGMFFGGHRPSATQTILGAHAPGWIGDAEQIFHIDLHTGLGRKATWKLLFGSEIGDAEWRALEQRFGPGTLEAPNRTADKEAVAYPARGLIEHWLPTLFAGRAFRTITAEFGTYGPMRVLEALRAENQAHHWGEPDADHAWTKAHLVEAFSPKSPAWRVQCVGQAKAIVEDAMAA